MKFDISAHSIDYLYDARPARHYTHNNKPWSQPSGTIHEELIGRTPTHVHGGSGWLKTGLGTMQSWKRVKP